MTTNDWGSDMTEFYSDQEMKRLCRPRLLASAAASLAWLSMLGTALSTWMLLFVLPNTLGHKVAIAKQLGMPLPDVTKMMVDVVRMLGGKPLLAWAAIAPPLIALVLAYMWRSRLCSLLGILLSLGLIGSPLVLLFLSAV